MPTWAISAASRSARAWLCAGAAGAARQLLRPGRAAAERPDGARESVLPARAALGALSAGGARHGRHGDRLAGHHLRRLLDGAAGRAAGPQPARARSSTPRPSEFGQIYVPAVNWLQLAGVVALVLAFKSSTNLAAAYGIAVTGTMLVTTLLVFALAVRAGSGAGRWRSPVFGCFLVVDGTLFVGQHAEVRRRAAGCRSRSPSLIFTAMWTWLKGRLAVAARENEGTLPMEDAARPASIPAASTARRAPRSISPPSRATRPTACCTTSSTTRCCTSRSCCSTVEVPDEPYVPPEQRAAGPPSRQGRAPRRAALRLHGAARRAARPAAAGRPRRAGRPDAHLLLRRPQQLRRRRAGRCCRAGRRSCSWCWRASPPAPATSSACPPTAWSSSAAGSRSDGAVR